MPKMQKGSSASQEKLASQEDSNVTCTSTLWNLGESVGSSNHSKGLLLYLEAIGILTERKETETDRGECPMLMNANLPYANVLCYWTPIYLMWMSCANERQLTVCKCSVLLNTNLPYANVLCCWTPIYHMWIFYATEHQFTLCECSMLLNTNLPYVNVLCYWTPIYLMWMSYANEHQFTLCECPILTNTNYVNVLR